MKQLCSMHSTCVSACWGEKMRSCLTCVVSASHNVSASRSCPADQVWVCLLMSLQAYDCVTQEVPQLVCQLVTHMLAGCPPAVLQRMVAAGCKIAIIGRHQVWVLCAGARFESDLEKKLVRADHRYQLAADTTVASSECPSSALPRASESCLCNASVCIGHHRHPCPPLHEGPQRL